MLFQKLNSGKLRPILNTLQTLKREGVWFEVTNLDVVDSRTRELVIEPGVRRLSLVTCYPFDSPLAGGPLRYVVTALPLNPRSPSSG